jgi:hypothetical protein
MGLITSSRKKDVVQEPNNQPRIGGIYWKETGCQGGQGSLRALAPSEEEEEELSVWASLTFMKIGVFWDVTPCGSCKNRRFGGTWSLLHQGDKNR